MAAAAAPDERGGHAGRRDCMVQGRAARARPATARSRLRDSPQAASRDRSDPSPHCASAPRRTHAARALGHRHTRDRSGPAGSRGSRRGRSDHSRVMVITAGSW